MAQTLVRYSVSLRKGDKVVIEGNDLAAPLIREVFREAVRAGAYPIVLASIDGVSEIFLKEASDEQLAFVPPHRELLIGTVDAVIGILSDYNTRALSGVDPKKQAAYSRAHSRLHKVFLERAARGELRWCGTLYPTHALAQEASMSLSEYEEFVFRACYVDQEDPVAKWREMQKHNDRIIEALKDIDVLRIVGEETDLTLSVKGRTWINADGHKNFPDGEIFTGPVETSANGHIRFSFPGIYRGNAIEDIRLTFRDGKVVDAKAKVGESLLKALLNTDSGASYLGELGIGTNYGIQRFSRHILFDEKIGGTVHLAVGSGYPETGSKNESGVHWDMICDLRNGGEIYGDGQLIYKDGKFVI